MMTTENGQEFINTSCPSFTFATFACIVTESCSSLPPPWPNNPNPPSSPLGSASLSNKRRHCSPLPRPHQDRPQGSAARLEAHPIQGQAYSTWEGNSGSNQPHPHSGNYENMAHHCILHVTRAVMILIAMLSLILKI